MPKLLEDTDFIEVLHKRLFEKTPFIQVLLGPRQVGKTTGILKLKAALLKKSNLKSHYFSADNLGLHPQDWLRHKWLATPNNELLIIDEVQRVDRWSELVKELWDTSPKRIKVLLLGSSSIFIQQGLKESLSGRFEMLRAHHWSFEQSKKNFKMSLEDYINFGGYPGSYELIQDFERWKNYIGESIINTVVNKDILSLARVKNPVIFRQAFDVLCLHPAQQISFTKLLGQLQEKGNVELIKYYIHLFEEAFLIKSLQKFKKAPLSTRLSSPKILILAPALVTYALGLHKTQTPLGGHCFENMVGAELSKIPHSQLYYWRELNDEVDFVLKHESQTYAIEVKSGRKKGAGLLAFKKLHPKAKLCLINTENFKTLNFKNPSSWPFL